MTARFRKSHRIVSIILTVALLISCLPIILTAGASEPGVYLRVSDPSTIDQWEEYFPISGDLTTQNAGGVWTDKSVFAGNTTIDGHDITLSDPNNFLVALSAIGSNMSVTGQAAAPTDTVMILDMSNSMHNSSLVDDLAVAANASMKTLFSANPNNRVAIVVYNQNYSTFLPLDTYTAGNGGNYLQGSRSNSYSTLRTVSGVKDGNGNNVSKTVNTAQQTNIQGGVKQAIDILKARTDTTGRIPAVILMTDGEATVGNTDIVNLGNRGSMGFDYSDDGIEVNAFVTQLTIAYMMQSAFKNETQKPLLYTIGVGSGVSGNSVQDILNPQATLKTQKLRTWWNTFADLSVGQTMQISKGSGYNQTNYTITKTAEMANLTYDYVTKITGSGGGEVNGYFAATSGNLSEQISNAFKQVVAEIVKASAYYPILVESVGENLSGYITFEDKIGKYMKIADIKVITHQNNYFHGNAIAKRFNDDLAKGGTDLGEMPLEGDVGYVFMNSVSVRLGITNEQAWALLNSAWLNGQLAYTSDTVFSNWFGWIADSDGTYIAPWHEGTDLSEHPDASYVNRSYIYLGESGDTNMMYATVRIREKIENCVLTGEQWLDAKVPSSLLPLITYNVSLDENGTPIAIDVVPNSPIRLIYEVGLDPEINEFNVKDKVSADYLLANTDPVTGEVHFYTNEWERTPDSAGKLTGYGKNNTYSYFRPSRQNDRYYYQNDSLVYSSKTPNGVYNSSVSPADHSGELYYYHSYYNKTGNAFETVYEYHTVPKEVLSVAQDNGNGTWTIKAGTIRSDYSASDAAVISKANNASATLGFSHEPFADSNSYAWNDTTHSSVVGVTLANNGRLSIMPETGIKLSKALSADVALGANENPVFTFDITYAGQNGSLQAYAYRFDKSGAIVGGREEVSFVSGKATVTLLAGETLYIGGMTSGTVTVTEEMSLKYAVQAVTVNGTPHSGASAGVTLETGDMKNISYVNTYRETGTFTVAKEVTHDFGPTYVVPNNENTNFSVDLTFTFNGKPLSGEYTVAHTDGNESAIKLNGTEGEKATIYLHNKDQYTVYGLPEGTVVTATENLTSKQKESFTASYWENISEATITANTVSQVLIINKYTAKSVAPTLTLTGTKSLTENTYFGDFKFSLQKYDGVGAYTSDSSWSTLEEQSVNYSHEKGIKNFAFTYNFASAPFDKIGTYVYRIHESKPTVEGMIYDSRIHSFQIDVTDTDMDGNLEATVSTTRAPHVAVGGSGNAWTVNADFVNEYTKDNFVTVDIDVQKTVENLSLSPLGTSLSGFDFGLYDKSGKLIQTLTTNSAGAVRFSLTYRASIVGDVGDHTYFLREIPHSPKKAGWTYSDKEVKVTVKVSGGTQLVADIMTDDTSATVNGSEVLIGFTNTYVPTEASLTVDFVSKQIASNVGIRPLKNSEFSFAIYEVVNGVRGSTPVATGTNDEFGAVTFDKTFTYDKVGGPYFYDIVELKPANAPAYITYDSTAYRMTVKITDEGGKLVATPVVESVAGNDVVFSNVYTAEPVSVTIEGTKALTGRALTENDFQFVLSESGTSNVWYAANESFGGSTSAFKFPALTFTQPGTFTYKVSEYDPAVSDGVKYDKTVYTVVVTVTDGGAGKLIASYTVDGSAANKIEFNNTYDPTSADAHIVGTKALFGRPLEAGEFIFDMYDASYNAGTNTWKKLDTLVDTAENEANGAIKFAAQTYTEAKTYYYAVTERNTSMGGVAYDGTVWYVAVKVVDNNHGMLVIDSVNFYNENGHHSAMVFTNTYTVTEGIFSLSGLKKLTGRDLVKDEFSFTLYDSDENWTEGSIVQTVKNNADGTFAFDDIKYDAAGTYFFLVKENEGNLNGVTYDNAVYCIKVEVTDNGEGNLIVTYTVDGSATKKVEFNNSYDPSSVGVHLVGTKKLNGRDLKAGEFTFDLYNASFNAGTNVWTKLDTLVDTAQNNIDGTIKFEAITYDEAKTYYYAVVERETDINGVTFDKTVWYVTVKVVDNKNGRLIVESVTYENASGVQEAMVFTNIYTASEGTFSLSGLKKLSGRVLIKDEFSFTLYNSNEGWAEVSVAQIVKNNADGTFAFDEIKYDTAGTYFYLVKENNGTVAGVTYDSTVYRIKVEVKDNGEGKLVVNYTVLGENNAEKEEIVFENTYLNPSTGDSVLKWIVPLAVSGAVITLLSVKKKRKDDEE